MSCEHAATLFDADEAAYSGTVEILGSIFRAEEDGYAVLEVQDADSGEGFALVGPVAHLRPGDRAQVSGEWQTHSRYGRQLRARGAMPVDPADREGQIAYLTSLRHIGPARAESLADQYGEKVLEAIAADPQGVFVSLRGISHKQAAAAAASWHAGRAVRDLHVQLAPHGLAHLAAPIHSRYGDDAMFVLHEDPYRLTEVEGVGFARADRIALAADVPPESDRRAQAAAVFSLGEAEQQGHTYLPIAELTRRAAKLLGLDPDPEVLVAAPGLLVEEGRAYRESTHASRSRWRATLTRRASAPPHLEHQVGRASRRRADRGAVGGGGRCLCLADLDPHRRPRGRQDRLHPSDRRRGGGGACLGRALRTNRSGSPAAGGGHRTRGKDDPSHARVVTGARARLRPGHPLPADLVIVDESSMLNLRLIEVLLDGLAESTHVVFVGDADQLPPIGAGKPFEDLINSGAAPVVRLSQIFRQAARSMITTAAHEINRGRLPHLRARR